MSDFKGTYVHNLDSKSRLVIPSAFKDDLGQKFVIMKTMKSKCLTLYPQSEWDKVRADLDRLPPGEQYERYYRKVFSRTDDCFLDPQGRIVIKEPFRDFAGLTKSVTILGSGKKVELWDTDLWNASNIEFDDFEVDVELVKF